MPMFLHVLIHPQRQDDTVPVVNVEVEPTDTVADLKAQLWQMRNVSSYRRDLNYRGLKLQDDRTLQHYGIKHAASVDLVDRHMNMQVFVSTPIGRVVELNIPIPSTAWEVKRMLMPHVPGATAADMVLTYLDTRWENLGTSGSIGLVSGETIHLQVEGMTQVWVRTLRAGTKTVLVPLSAMTSALRTALRPITGPLQELRVDVGRVFQDPMTCGALPGGVVFEYTTEVPTTPDLRRRSRSRSWPSPRGPPP